METKCEAVMKELKAKSELRAKIIAAPDRGEAIEHIDEWDMDLLVMGMNAAERAMVVGWSVNAEGDNEQIGATMLSHAPELLVKCVYDPATRERVFEDTAEDIAILRDKSGQVIERLLLSVIRLSGLDKEAVDEEKKD